MLRSNLMFFKMFLYKIDDHNYKVRQGGKNQESIQSSQLIKDISSN